MSARMGPELSTPLLASAVVLAFVLCLNTYIVADLVRRRSNQSRVDKEQNARALYQDNDGEATVESQLQYKIRKPKWVSLTGAVTGILVSFYISVHSLASSSESWIMNTDYWLIFVCWMSVLIMTVFISAEREPVVRYKYGAFTATATIGIFFAVCCQLYSFVPGPSERLSDGALPIITCQIFEAVSAAVTCVACLSFPRRPSVEVRGQFVDLQFTVSALNYITLRWANNMLSLAKSKLDLEVNDLPLLHHKGRSAYLMKRFGADADTLPLWQSLLYLHWRTLAIQSISAVMQATIQFAPTLAMNGLLQLRERRTDSNSVSTKGWLLVAALGGSLIIAAWADIWIMWVGYSRIALAIRSELSALVFAKATRRKDVKGKPRRATSKDTERVEALLLEPINSSFSAVNMIRSTSTVVPKDDVERNRESTINLISVDTKRVSDFLRDHFVLVQVAAKLIVGGIILVQLLGWLPVLAGFASFFPIVPLNIWTSKRFTDAQDDLMSNRDQKLMVLTESLQGIRQIKFSAQEREWQERINRIRGKELAILWRIFCLETVLCFCWILGPVLLSAVALAVYAALYESLPASVAFTSVTLFNSLEFTLGILPEFMTDGLEARSSLGRIQEYLRAPERGDYPIPERRIVFHKATISWPSDASTAKEDDRFVLRDVSLSILNKGLTVVTGPTGSGKSLFLASIIGEADLLDGMIRAPRTPLVKDRCDDIANKSDWIIDSATAFVAQIPWIENGTIKENILFHLPYDRGRYNKVIKSCALMKDLDVLPDGDDTDIGFNGINLSGGQRWRISFARALYSRAGILILDDIFSAVDAHVGRQLLEEALTGELGLNRTRVLATHHTSLCLPKADWVVTLGNGTVQHAGSPNDLRRKGALDSHDLYSRVSAMEIGVEQPVESATNIDGSLLARMLSSTSQSSQLIDRGEQPHPPQHQRREFTEKESKEQGSVKIKIYRDYVKMSGGVIIWLPILAFFIAHQGLTVGRSWFVSNWTRSYRSESSSLHTLMERAPGILQNVMSANVKPDLAYYLSIYLGLSLLLCISGPLQYFFVYTRSIRASKEQFQKMTFAVLRAPLRWLDTVPVGRLLNRFTADFENIDSKIGGDLGPLLYQIIRVVGIVSAGAFVSPYMLVIAFGLFILCAWVTSWYLAGAREVKRLESIAKSPILEQFGSTLTGIGTIRAFDKTEIYLDRMFEKIDAHARAYWHVILFNRWVALRMEAIGAVFATLVAAFVAYADIDASLAGFALSFALQYSATVLWASRSYANVELSMNSVERVSEYSNIPIEPQNGRIEAPAAWPTEGRLEVNDLVVGYAPDQPPVLKGLSFCVEPNQRVGVVGRTGAGKSSLTLAIFRFLETQQGSITIDGINIADLSLQTLRSRLAIIPQDPVLFSGTVRWNLDPFNDHTNDELEDALRRVHLTRSTSIPSRDEPTEASSSSNIPGPPTTTALPTTNPSLSLTTPISESGLNLSQGQRQLLCLARAIVRRPKILVLDEATSAVDMATDLLIQKSIREEFRDATLLVIAHRLSTVRDFDRILVMEDGRGVEFGSPEELVGRRGGVFRGMVESLGGSEGGA